MIVGEAEAGSYRLTGARTGTDEHNRTGESTCNQDPDDDGS
jgi:hypothetical protein